MSTVELEKLSEKEQEMIKWMDETIYDVPSNRFLYRLACFLLGKRKKKLTYNELYLFYKNVYGEEKKEDAVKALLEIYKWNTGHYPENC